MVAVIVAGLAVWLSLVLRAEKHRPRNTPSLTAGPVTFGVVFSALKGAASCPAGTPRPIRTPNERVPHGHRRLRPARRIKPLPGRPDANMRTHTFGGGGHGLAIYLVLEADRRVVILRVLWVG